MRSRARSRFYDRTSFNFLCAGSQEKFKHFGGMLKMLIKSD